MKRYIISPIFLAVITFLCLGPITAQRKNVLFIAVDDLKPILGCYGDTLIHTPNMNRLASEGIVFTNCHCQQAVCAPSRASLMTGMRPDRTRIWDLKTWIRDMNPDILTIPQYFMQNGYFCTGAGKVFDRRSVDKSHDSLSWSEPFLFFGDSSHYHPVYGAPVLAYYQLPETREIVERLTPEAISKGLKRFAIKQYVMNTIKPSTECADVPDNAYIDGNLALTAIERLERIATQGQPFFLAVGFKRPHLPFVAPKKYWDLYEREKMPLAEFQRPPEDGPRIALHSSNELRSYTDIPNLSVSSDTVGWLSETKQRELVHGYYASVSYIDAMIGKIIRSIDSLGLRENTVIVLWGDHGWHLGDHSMWCKHSNFEQATRAPLIFSSPGIRVRTSSAPVEFVDIFPTLCDLTGIEKPGHLDGRSLLPIMNGTRKKTKKYAVSQYPRQETMGYAFRDDRYRYVVWLGNNYRSTERFDPQYIAAEELYDYRNDPLETVNFAHRREYEKVIQEMRAYSIEFFNANSKSINPNQQ